MFSVKTVDAQMPGFWSDIFSNAQKLLHDYKSASADPRVQEKVTFQKLLPAGFIAVKTTVPAVTVRVTANYPAHRIEYAMTRTPHREAKPLETSGRLRIVLDDAGELCAQTDERLLGTPQQVAEFLLGPLLKAIREPH